MKLTLTKVIIYMPSAILKSPDQAFNIGTLITFPGLVYYLGIDISLLLWCLNGMSDNLLDILVVILKPTRYHDNQNQTKYHDNKIWLWDL